MQVTPDEFKKIVIDELKAYENKLNVHRRKIKFDVVFNIIVSSIGIAFIGYYVVGVTSFLAGLIYLMAVQKEVLSKRYKSLDDARQQFENACKDWSSIDTNQSNVNLQPNVGILEVQKKIVSLLKDIDKTIRNDNTISAALAIIGAIAVGITANEILKNQNEHHGRIAMEWATAWLARSAVALGISIWRTNIEANNLELLD